MQLHSKLLMAMGLAALMAGAVAGPARADDDDHWHHGWHEREWHGWHGWHRPGVVIYGGPRYVYAPPPPVIYEAPPPVVYEAPPPVYYAPPPSAALNVVVPLHFH